MLSLKPRFRGFGVVAFILIALSWVQPSRAQAGATSVGRYAGDLPPSFTLTEVLTETEPCPAMADPTTEVVTVTSSGSTTVLASQYFYAGDPVYRKPAAGDFKLIDYDERGNFLVWRKVETRRLFTPAGDDAVKTSRLYRVSPEGKVTAETSVHTQIVRGVPATPQGLSDLDLAILPLGQGFSRYLPAIPTGNASGALAKRIPVRLSPAVAGTWELLPAKENDRLIRNARFFGQRDGETAIEVKTSGVARFQGTVLARRGEIRLGAADEAYGLAVELKSFTPRADDLLIEEVRRQINGPLAKGTEIMDLRGVTIERIFVGEPIPVPAKEKCCVCQPVTVTLSECGHLQESTKCASDWCITNVVNSATCANVAPSGVASCSIVSPVPIQPMVIQTPTLIPDGGCPTAGKPVSYAVKLTTYDGCTACTPTSPFVIRTACDVDKCPAGAALDRCASERGIRRACA